MAVISIRTPSVASQTLASWYKASEIRRIEVKMMIVDNLSYNVCWDR